jgi:hypothetical protein
MDWADGSWVDGTVERALGGSIRDRRLYSIGMIADLIVNGLVVAGDLGADGTYHPWTAQGGTAVERIVVAWGPEWDNRQPELGSFFWLSNTDRGDALARQVLYREAGGVVGAPSL